VNKKRDSVNLGDAADKMNQSVLIMRNYGSSLDNSPAKLNKSMIE